MIAIAISLSVILSCSNCLLQATRLPLEVFEIPESVQTYSSSPVIHIQSNSENINNNNNNNHSNNNNNNDNDNDNINTNRHFKSNSNHMDRRRSRQMAVEVSQPQQTPRILYQVGNSESDLPICAPNAVCSKIDLYESPWIERQCRCPEVNTVKPIINHFKDYSQFGDQRYRPYFQGDKGGQHKHSYDAHGNRLDNLHLRKLMQKLGAVYQDDIILDESDLSDHDEFGNSYLNRGSIDHGPGRNHEIKKLRHSGHRKDITYIGGCSSYIGSDDGHTIADKTRHYKLCNPVHRLPMCRYFRDYTWTLSSSPDVNVTEQVVHCRCPRNSITYLTKREPLAGGKAGYSYLFACSPQSRLRCQRKEPCKLFTVRKRQEFLDEVNINPLCQCPKGHRCPTHHTDSSVIPGKSYIEDNIQTYSGYCMAND